MSWTRSFHRLPGYGDRPQLTGRRLRPGDVVYIEDLYLELDGDGGWHRLTPGELTRQLYGPNLVIGHPRPARSRRRPNPASLGDSPGSLSALDANREEERLLREWLRKGVSPALRSLLYDRLDYLRHERLWITYQVPAKRPSISSGAT